MATFLIKARTKDGFEVHFAGDYPSEFDLIYHGMVADADFGFTPLGAAVVQTFPAQSSAQSSGGNPLACQFCGKDVEPVKFGKIDQTAQEVATGRATKMGKLGRTPAPVCGKCWKQGGHAAAWDEHYKNSQS